uniref:WD_REPEATS_REGION domain-containing protein n=1 Tax=Globodera pallida TaxID=36090 RepID=A0A183C2F9_GLOPA
MNTNYQFADIIGTVYRNGQVKFMPDGNVLLSPIGNRLKTLDLKRNTSFVLATQLRSNITKFDINFAGTHAFVVTETGHGFYLNLFSDTVLHRQLFSERVRALKFSPDGRFIAIGVSGFVHVYSIAAFNRVQFNPFIRVNKFKHSADRINALDWSDDGRLIVVGGENRVTKIFSALKATFANVGVYVLGERASLVDVRFFDEYNLLCVDKIGSCSIWESSLGPGQLVLQKKGRRQTNDEQLKSGRLSFARKKRQQFWVCLFVAFNLCVHANPTSSGSVALTAICLNKVKKLLVSAFNNGVFCICELPGLVLLQNFRVSEVSINSIDLNSAGSWLAIGCGQGSDSQLLVWEWQSESYLLRQQSHRQNIAVAAYSPDGSLIATGAEDGKVKIWNCSTSFCVVTFTDHGTGVSDVCFTQSGKAVLSASLEGTVRAHDLKRYRNFQTMVAPKQTQLNALCADKAGDLVIASSGDSFDVYVWALTTGQLLEVLNGHMNLVTGLTMFENTLCSTSLDKTLKLWNIVEGTCLESVQLSSEGLDVKHSASGMFLAVLCYDSSICLFDTVNSQQLGTIDIKLDIDAGRQKVEKIKKTSSERNKSFTCIAFSPDGSVILVGGQSNTFCLYSVADRIRIRTFKLSFNASLDGVKDDINSRRQTEFGNIDLFDLSDSEEDERNPRKTIRLPGTRHTDLAERAIHQPISVVKAAFCPTGATFAIVSTDGVAIYSLHRMHRFDPFKLEMDVVPSSIVQLSHSGEHAKAISLALRLNDVKLTRRVVESVPFSQLSKVVRSLELIYIERLLVWLLFAAGQSHEKHLHFYQLLIKEILKENASELKRSLAQNRQIVTGMQQMVANRQNLLMEMCAQNMHSLGYLLLLRRMNCVVTTREP